MYIYSHISLLTTGSLTGPVSAAFPPAAFSSTSPAALALYDSAVAVGMAFQKWETVKRLLEYDNMGLSWDISPTIWVCGRYEND